MKVQRAYQGVMSREKLLQKQNNQLKQQLAAAQQLIVRLRHTVQELRLKVAQLQSQKQFHNQSTVQYYDSTPQVSSILKNSSYLKSPTKSTKSIKFSKGFKNQLESFSESDEQNSSVDEFNQLPQQSTIRGQENTIRYLGRDKSPLSSHGKMGLYYNASNIINERSKHGSTIKLQSKASYDRSLKKIDTSLLVRSKTKTFDEVDPDEQNVLSPLKQLKPKTKYFSMSSISKSEKQINNSHFDTYQSEVKQEGQVKEPIAKIFKKITVQNQIFDVFFVTGLDRYGKPTILYTYPHKSSHSEVILSLCYTEHFLRKKQVIHTQSQSYIRHQKQLDSQMPRIKEFYVIPLCKGNQDNQKEYLVVCEVEEVVITEKEKEKCIFERLYCFITSCKFFHAYKSLISQFLDKINNYRNKSVKYCSEEALKVLLWFKQEIVEKSLQQPLQILSQKRAQQNHSLNYRLDSFISIAIDIPSAQNSYKLISQYRAWDILNLRVQLSAKESHLVNIQTKLFGILLVYGLSEKKVILYSAYKSKISQCILQFLQIIKPLEYVCPVLMTALKEEHQEYFSAPMSLLLGLWTDKRRDQKKKLQVSTKNKEQNLTRLIDKGKIQICDGIVINLDTGFVYGEGLNEMLNNVVGSVNQFYQSYCHYSKQMYKFFEKILQGKLSSSEEHLFTLQKKLLEVVANTQLFSYFKEKKTLRTDRK